MNFITEISLICWHWASTCLVWHGDGKVKNVECVHSSSLEAFHQESYTSVNCSVFDQVAQCHLSWCSVDCDHGQSWMHHTLTPASQASTGHLNPSQPGQYSIHLPLLIDIHMDCCELLVLKLVFAYPDVLQQTGLTLRHYMIKQRWFFLFQ